MSFEFEHRQGRGRAVARTNEQQRQDYREYIEAVARSLKVTPEALSDDRVRRYVGLVVLAHELHDALTDGVEVHQSGMEACLSTTQTSSLADRCLRAELLLRGAIHILETAFDSRPASAEYLANKVGNALGPYGVRVEAQSGSKASRS